LKNGVEQTFSMRLKEIGFIDNKYINLNAIVYLKLVIQKSYLFHLWLT